jgi:drug/metabolite transporter (DMT)-like permease
MSTGKAIFCKAIGTEGGSKKEKALLNFKAFVVAFLSALLFTIKDIGRLFEISAFSFILSIFFGLSIALTQIFQSKALGQGPASTVTLIYACGFLIPIFYGLFFWGESVSVFQWLGIALLLFSLTLCLLKKEKSCEFSSWIPFAIAAMLGSGASAIFQKTHQYSDFSSEISFYLVFCLFFSSVFTGIAYLITKKDKNVEKEVIDKKRVFFKSFIIPGCLGICVGALNFLNLILSGNLPSVILFPIYNVGSMLLVILLSAIIYKDKMTTLQKIGFFLGIAAILLIGLL